MTIDIEYFLDTLAGEVESYQVPVVDLIAIQTEDPYKILVATILSARTRDEVTAKAAERLFAKAPDLAGLAELEEDQLSRLIKPVGFFNNKAGYLKKLPRIIEDKFGGEIPREINELTSLPGVGRKTANLVRAVAFKLPAICVDTHVHRIMNIWGYVDTKSPLATEMALRKKLPESYWLKVNGILVAFGQGTCRPVSPHCDRCPIADDCPKTGVTPRRRPADTSPRTPGERALRLISWNVNGIRALEKKGLPGLIKDLDADILALQEIKAMPEQLSEQLLNIPGYTAHWNPAAKKGYSGVCVYSRITPVSVSSGLGIEAFDREGRLITLEFSDFFLVNTYFPNAQHGLARLDYKLQFDQAVADHCRQLAKTKTVVIAGDFNVAHREIDLANPKTNTQNPGFCPEERAWMDHFLERGFLDTFRLFNQEPEQYTWWSYRFNARARNIGWRIDYFCIDQKSRRRVAGAAIHSDIMGSDHCPIELLLS